MENRPDLRKADAAESRRGVIGNSLKVKDFATLRHCDIVTLL